jgi:competence protein ComEC
LLFTYLKPTQAGILSAMILGSRSKISPTLRRLFIHTGTMHILAISGLHVGIVAFILDLLLKAFLRIKRHTRYLAIILCLILYCFLTGARPSVIRATIMAIVLLVGFLLHREIKASHSLALAALIILITNSRQLFNLGFQLSFASVISIVYFSPILKRYLGVTGMQKSTAIFRFASNAFCVSFAAWLGVLPFLVYYFQIISPVTVLANLVVVPYLVLVIALAFSLLFIGIIFPVFAPVFAAPANLSIVTLIQIIKLFNRIPWAYFYL